MAFENTQFDDINITNLQSLIDNKVAEGKSYEYKSELPGMSDPHKKEFLADVSSFTNDSGGYLLFGIKERAGIPIELIGLENIDPDAIILKLESSIRDGIEPRIPGLIIKAVELKNSNVILIVRIPRSWASPHMVTFKNHSKFYSRNSAGKYQLDVSEIRSAFLFSESFADSLRTFRTERLANIIADETPVHVRETAKAVLHVVPLSASRQAFDLSNIVKKINPILTHADEWTFRHNFDGFVLSDVLPGSPFAESYIQIFRNGSIELVDTTPLRQSNGKMLIPSVNFENQVEIGLQKCTSILKDLAIEPPLFLMLTLTGVLGYRIQIESYRGWRTRIPKSENPIDRDILVIPENIIESYDAERFDILKSIFDAVWNAAGWPRSINYDDSGKRMN